MDADTVKKVEFSRKVRGYDVAQVDAFLEELEVSLRRGRLEQENLRHKLEELSGARDAQSEMLSVLNGQMLLTQEENQRLTERIKQLEKELEERQQRVSQLEEQLTLARQKPVQPKEPATEPVLPPWEEPVEKKWVSLEDARQRLLDVGTAAKDSIKKLSALRKK